MNTPYLAVYKADAGSRWDRVIGDWTRDPRLPCQYSHVELVFSDGIAFSSSPRDGGTRFKRIYFDDKWHMYNLGELTQERAIRAWCASQVPARYDWRGILGFNIPLVDYSLNHWFCSEVTTTAVQIEGLLTELKPIKTSPNAQVAALLGLPPLHKANVR
jgi:hypothetical protein